MRTGEFVATGIAATISSRIEKDGSIQKLPRGLYQRTDADLDIHHDLAEAAKRVSKGVVCLFSALAFHDLMDQIPRRIGSRSARRTGSWASMARSFTSSGWKGRC